MAVQFIKQLKALAQKNPCLLQRNLRKSLIGKNKHFYSNLLNNRTELAFRWMPIALNPQCSCFG